MLCALWLCLGAAVLGLLAGVALTVAIVLACWAWSPLAAALALAALYGGSAAWLGLRVARLHREWKPLPATLAELQKDRACLEKSFN